jgi:peptidoglycan/xylan/chitin deacetylase (PgdA/CDA1 family)
VTLLVQAPPGDDPDRRYILDVVLCDWLGLEWELSVADRRDVRIVPPEEPDGPAVTVPDALFATPSDAWLTEASLPRSGALYDGDVFGSAFFMLTRYEELVVADRDEYGRFPAAASVTRGLLDRPVVDEQVERLWESLQRAWPRLQRRPRAYEVVLSHDVDDPLATLQHTPADVVRQLGGDLVRRRDPRLAARRLRSLLGAPELDPNNTFDFLMQVSERHGVRSAFYFLAHRDERPREGDYLFEHPWVRSLIGRIADRGHEIGIHPSLPTYRDGDLTRQELERLRRVAEAEGVRQEEWGGRQHYLRWTNPDTWRNWEAAGLAYDCTLAYSEAAGFRTGTCHPYRAFDLRARRPLDLREEPFQVMDVTLLSSMGLSLDAARAAVLEIAAQCRRHRGRLGILWHNNTLLRSAREQQWYASLIEAVTSH